MSEPTLELLFTIANTAVLPAWLLLMVAPTAGITRQAVHSGLVPGAIAVLYAVLLVTAVSSGAVPPDADFTSLAGIRVMLASPIAALAGWVHYLCFDLVVGAWIARDGSERGVNRLWLAVVLFFTLMVGPFGLLMHLVTRGRSA